MLGTTFQPPEGQSQLSAKTSSPLLRPFLAAQPWLLLSADGAPTRNSTASSERADLRDTVMEAMMQTETTSRESRRLVASDRVEGTPVRRTDGTTIGTIERVMIDK